MRSLHDDLRISAFFEGCLSYMKRWMEEHLFWLTKIGVYRNNFQNLKSYFRYFIIYRYGSSLQNQEIKCNWHSNHSTQKKILILFALDKAMTISWATLCSLSGPAIDNRPLFSVQGILFGFSWYRMRVYLRMDLNLWQQR